MEDKLKKVVVIGGGFAGSEAAKRLENKFDVILIDKEDFFEFTPGILRTIVEPQHYKKIQAKHKDYLKKAKIITDCVTEVGKDYVKIKKSKRKINFDYLVIASGSSYNSPIKEENVFFVTRVRHLQKTHEKLESAKKICIVGGGLVGVELMAEICTHYKDKELSLIHAHNKLIERNNEKSGKYAEKFLKEHNVELIFNERVKGLRNKKLITENGREFNSDLTFFTVGIKPNFSFMKDGFSDKIEKGIKVNDYLQLQGFRNIFVAGDVTGIKEEKTAQNAGYHAGIVAKNIIALENKRKLKKYKNRKRFMVISLGKYNGIIEYKNFIFTGKIAAFLKWAIERFIMFGYM